MILLGPGQGNDNGMRKDHQREVFMKMVGLTFLILLMATCQGTENPQSQVVATAEPTAVSASQASIATTTPFLASTTTPSVTPTVTASSTTTTTPTASPTPTPTPTATPTPLPEAIRLTGGGCCTQPFWSPDSTQVRFIDKPGPQARVGIWGVSIDASLAEPTFVSERLEESLAGPEFLIDRTSTKTVIERLSTGERWDVPAAGERVVISPDRTRIAWSASNENVLVEQRISTIWVANLDGSEARQVVRLPRGSLSGWVSDDVLLVSGRESLQKPEQILYRLDLRDDSITELARADRLRSASISPSGQWLVYYSTFSTDIGENGLWFLRTDGSERRQLDRKLFGAYQWRGCEEVCTAENDRLIIVPFDPKAVYHEFWEMNPSSNIARPLTDPAQTPFKIANGDWRVSPDGRYIAYVESADRNIWVIALPE
jgi:hypothetical protein